MFKKKLINHITKKGKKQVIEKIITKSIKQFQKQQKRNIANIIQLSITNTTPVFRMINLTNKNRRKKSIKRIPLLLANNNWRSSLGLKNLANYIVALENRKTLDKKFVEEFLLAAKFESNIITSQNEIQSEASKEKKYFRFFRW
jgi:ribosomal protein S7